MAVVIECKNVTYSYPLTTKPAISNLNLSLERGKWRLLTDNEIQILEREEK